MGKDLQASTALSGVPATYASLFRRIDVGARFVPKPLDPKRGSCSVGVCSLGLPASSCSCKHGGIWDFPKLRLKGLGFRVEGIIWGVPLVRVIVFHGVYIVVPPFGKLPHDRGGFQAQLAVRRPTLPSSDHVPQTPHPSSSSRLSMDDSIFLVNICRLTSDAVNKMSMQPRCLRSSPFIKCTFLEL